MSQGTTPALQAEARVEAVRVAARVRRDVAAMAASVVGNAVREPFSPLVDPTIASTPASTLAPSATSTLTPTPFPAATSTTTTTILTTIAASTGTLLLLLLLKLLLLLRVLVLLLVLLQRLVMLLLLLLQGLRLGAEPMRRANALGVLVCFVVPPPFDSSVDAVSRNLSPSRESTPSVLGSSKPLEVRPHASLVGEVCFHATDDSFGPAGASRKGSQLRFHSSRNAGVILKSVSVKTESYSLHLSARRS